MRAPERGNCAQVPTQDSGGGGGQMLLRGATWEESSEGERNDEAGVASNQNLVRFTYLSCSPNSRRTIPRFVAACTEVVGAPACGIVEATGSKTMCSRPQLGFRVLLTQFGQYSPRGPGMCIHVDVVDSTNPTSTISVSLCRWGNSGSCAIFSLSRAVSVWTPLSKLACSRETFRAVIYVRPTSPCLQASCFLSMFLWF